jgi:RpiR family carbohydrate utilization transcriptional regulator
MAERKTTLVQQIADLGEKARSAERRLAQFLLAAPASILHMNLSSVAAGADISAPTVIRFCRKLGCDGFPAFKIRLAQDLASARPYVPQNINYGDDVPEVFTKVVESTIDGLNSLKTTVPIEPLRQAIRMLASANRIEIFASGLTTELVAVDAQRKFLILEIPTSFYPDPALQLLSLPTLKPGDVAFCISYTGFNAHVIKCARSAAERGARVFAITRSNTALSEAVELSLSVDTIESIYLYAQIATSLAHLTLIDVLATGVALQRGPGIMEKVRSVKDQSSSSSASDGAGTSRGEIP